MTCRFNLARTTHVLHSEHCALSGSGLRGDSTGESDLESLADRLHGDGGGGGAGDSVGDGDRSATVSFRGDGTGTTGEGGSRGEGSGNDKRVSGDSTFGGGTMDEWGCDELGGTAGEYGSGNNRPSSSPKCAGGELLASDTRSSHRRADGGGGFTSAGGMRSKTDGIGRDSCHGE